MAYQFADSFDHYNTASQMYDSVTNGPPTYSSAYARFPQIGSFPNQGVLIPGACIIRKNLKSNASTLIAFMSFGAGALPGSNFSSVLNFYDNGTLQTSLNILSDGSLGFYRSGNVLLVKSNPGLISPVIAPNHGIEVKIVFANGTGSVMCYMDGNLVIPLTGSLNTIATANSYANQVSLGVVQGTAVAIYSDYLRVWDSTGSFQNAPLGYDVRKLTKLPTAPGAFTEWTPTAGANWQCVDENPPNSDTDYVSSASSGLRDAYGMGSAGLVGAVSMVVAKSFVRKDDGATRAIEIGVYSGGSVGVGSPITVGSSYAFVDSCISTDPATGSAPTPSAADAFQHYKIEST